MLNELKNTPNICYRLQDYEFKNGKQFTKVNNDSVMKNGKPYDG